MRSSSVSPAIATPLFSRVDSVGAWIAPAALRALLAWEFVESGLEKFNGENWFAELGDKFPWPFSLLGADASWFAATWLELIGGLALLLGLGTRYAAFALWVLTVVAIYTVHWPDQWSSLAELWQGYAISDQGHGNYKLPLIYLAMLLPLALGGGGRLSLDHLIARSFRSSSSDAAGDGRVWALVALGFGLPTALLLPWLGGALIVAAAGLAMAATLRRATPQHAAARG
ncbi:DoxX family membrane protein [Lysobacter sp. K5869]|uniref:HvfX family Cu-binding RiPP maturation protein n=1 Tax=Lysobacter sp. K5869 TaxID=2820808 RepID=UPI001C062952|nr:DoxX family protein [Lysobacter sp. K5869]QWP74980.1 DoxX family membrane protein [Lysobacter sp. K5869]